MSDCELGISSRLAEECKGIPKQVSISTNSASLQRLKDSVRKLPLFETFKNEDEQFDFEWPTRAQLKAVTNAKQLRLKEIRYQQDILGVLTAIKFVGQDMQSPFFAASLDKKSAPITLNLHSFYDRDDGHYRVNNIAARIEFNSMISNIYFNHEKNGISRIGTKRGQGPLSHVSLAPGE